MALHYEWSFDLAQLGGASLTGSDDGGAFSVSMTSGTYAHTSINSVVSGYTAFAGAKRGGCWRGFVHGDLCVRGWR
jgi:hypothetical protein